MTEFLTSPAQFKDFVKSHVGKDIKREVEMLVRTADVALRNEKDPKEFYTWQGRATACEDIIIMIEGFADEVEEELLVDIDDDGNPIDLEGGEDA